MMTAVRYTVLALNILLITWLLFYQQLQVPVWLQVAGRMHPLLLHFPVVLWILWAAWHWLGKHVIVQDEQRYKIDVVLLACAALLSALTAVPGLLLSREEGYEGDLLTQHLYGGSILSLSGLVLLFFPILYRTPKRWGRVVPLLPVVGVVLAGHSGASLTHGSQFLTGPLHIQSALPMVAFADARLFDHGVQPILEAKCYSCHNEGKRKGELLMTTREGLLAGGKSGAMWDTANPSASLMLQRIHLPLEAEEHMPPKGKLQLTDEEKTILDAWVALGASFDQKFAALPQDHILYSWASARWSSPPQGTGAYRYPAYDDALVQKLNTQYCVIYPIAQDAQSLVVQFYGSGGFSAGSLEALEPLRRNIAHLNLSRMPLTDDMLKVVARMEGLEILQLNHTPVTSKGLAHLSSLQHLQKISLNGTSLDAAGAEVLLALPALQVVHAGNTRLTPALATGLSQKKQSIQWVTGPLLDSMVLPLNAPIIDHVDKVFEQKMRLRLRHPIAGVSLRYTLDGTEPDSVNSPVYSDTMHLYASSVLKVRAFKPGWIGSSTAEAGFFSRMHKADTVMLKQPPHANYAADGALSLQDGKLSDKNFKSGLWLGFKDAPMEAIFLFHNAVEVQSVSLSTIVDIGSYIMPAARVELWGMPAGSTTWQLINQTNPAQPREVASTYLSALQVPVRKGMYKGLRMLVHPVNPLPAWHPGKGDKGWFFVDEVFIN